MNPTSPTTSLKYKSNPEGASCVPWPDATSSWPHPFFQGPHFPEIIIIIKLLFPEIPVCAFLHVLYMCVPMSNTQ